MSDNISKILSVGIDIGTSTTQLIFSKLTIVNTASPFAVPKIKVTDKEVVYKSNIHFTPLIDNQTIDSSSVKEIIAGEFRQANVDQSQLSTGAVIITGETARKDNAQEVLNMLSDFAGDFVVATAGPDLEGIIAGRGSGADMASKDNHTYVVNIDIGGGTSNFAIFNSGEVYDTGCLDVGGRLIKLNPKTREITYITPKLAKVIEDRGWSIQVGDIVDRQKLMPVIDFLVSLLEQALGLIPESLEYQDFLTNKGLDAYKVQLLKGITFSGGVADIVYNPDKYDATDDFAYGDIGILLGKAIRKSQLMAGFHVFSAVETIRATVVGAGSHTMDVSGSTICYKGIEFPIKNLPIIKVSSESELDLSLLADDIIAKLNWYKEDATINNIALALRGNYNPSFADVQEYAKAIIRGLKPLIDQGSPIIVMVEHDMGKVLGNAILALSPEIAQIGLVSIDGVIGENGDYLDLGQPIMDGLVLPVVIKTLVFSGKNA